MPYYTISKSSSKTGVKIWHRIPCFCREKKDYPVSEFNDYASGNAIAISTYKGLFNINPKFNDANVIIFDDAHAGENYIVSLWSVEINRFEHKELFLKIISLFEDKLSTFFVESLREKGAHASKNSVHMIPAPTLWERLDGLRPIIDGSPEESFSFSWKMIRENLASCNVFISWHKILIRPWIPPTRTHAPFENATQRIYMSATLGASGELERIIGLPKIDRIQVPAGWDKQGSGRIFFIFPNQSFGPNEYNPWVANRICKQSRTLVLCPDNKSATLMEEIITKKCTDLTILKSEAIKNSIEPFTAIDKAVLILANRYDGIDLPDDTCRQLIIAGNPDAINLQEIFLLNQLSIFSLLKDRIITRFTQATGRCTRGIRDYSLVILVGATLHQFCLKKENLEAMHPELQAELKFGLANSDVKTINELSELVDLFFKQGDDWKNADQEIRELRQSCNIIKDKRSKTLIEVVKDEVDYQYFLWNGDYRHALKSAQNVIDKLSGDDFKSYRALWYYFAGCIAWQLWHLYPKEGFEKLVKDFFDRAANCINTTSWFSNVALPSEISIAKDSLSTVNIYSAELIQGNIVNYDITGKNFEIKMNGIKEFIFNNSPSKFEEGLTQLGTLLGFNTEHPTDLTAPDSFWRITDSLLIIFEAKSDEAEDGGISPNTCKQAKGHYDWAKSNISGYDRINKRIVVVVSQRKKMDKNALPFATNLYYMHIGRIREIFESIYGVYSRVRSQYTSYNEEDIQSKIIEELVQKKLDPKSLIKEIENTPLNKISQI